MPRLKSMVVFRQQQVRARKFALKRLLVLLSFVAVLAGGWYVVMYTDPLNMFQLQRIEITGNQRTTTNDIRKALGVRIGTPLFRLDMAQLNTKLTKLPWVKSVRTHRTLPNVLFVEIVEHTPVAVIANGKTQLVSSEGCVMPQPVDGYPVSLPVITNYSGEIPAVGKQFEEYKMREVIALLREMRPYRVYQRVAEVRFDSPSTYRVLLDDGHVELLLGKSRIQSISAVDQFMQKLPAGVSLAKIAYIDARASGFIAVADRIDPSF
ncbi:MAG: FtsQ-type POTRA domain-containing protein [bacterium]|nr:FtsQ-type POTRA domain-containing protein [bacterium]